MLSLCFRYTGDMATAQDVLQEGFITVFNQLDKYQGLGSFEGWVRKIFVTASLMQLRRKDTLKDSCDIDNIRSLGTTDISALDSISYDELLKLVSKLPDGFRTVFNMYVIEGYSHKEISEILQITEVASRTKLSRAREWLKAKITESNR